MSEMSELDREYPYQIHLDKGHYHLIESMRNWCVGNIGTGGYWALREGDHWCVLTAFGRSSWCFKNQNDATLFTLKWL